MQIADAVVIEEDEPVAYVLMRAESAGVEQSEELGAPVRMQPFVGPGEEPPAPVERVVLDGAPQEEGAGAAELEEGLLQVALADALERTPLVAYAGLDMPALLLSGGAGPRCGQYTAQLLASTLPHSVATRFPALGHMGPVVGAAQVAHRQARRGDAPFGGRGQRRGDRW